MIKILTEVGKEEYILINNEGYLWQTLSQQNTQQ